MKQTVDFSKIHRNLIETFEEVKKAVQKNDKISRSGLMLGLQEMGASLDGFIGAYYPVASNIIIVNKTPLRRIVETDKTLLKPYVFHILLHEYIHSLGFLDEEITVRKTYEISKKEFGEHHIVTQLSTNIRKYLPNLVYPIYGWISQKETPRIELIQGFDASSIHPYIT